MGLKIFKEWQRLLEVQLAALDAGGLFNDYDLHKVEALDTDIDQMDSLGLKYWLSKFAMEVAKMTGERYPPRTVYEIFYTLTRYLEEKNGPEALNPLDVTDKR